MPARDDSEAARQEQDDHEHENDATDTESVIHGKSSVSYAYAIERPIVRP